MTNRVDIWTDGSCNLSTRVGAWSYLIKYRGKDYITAHSIRNTTSNEMELTAIVNAIKKARELDGEADIFVYTDSMYCINCATKWAENWLKNRWLLSNGDMVKNKELVKKLYCLQKDRVYFCYVRGHNKNINNNIVDRIAVSCRKRRDRKYSACVKEIT